MRYTVVQYSTASDTEIVIGEHDILVGIDTTSNKIIVLRFTPGRYQ